MFNKLATFFQGVTTAVKTVLVQCVALPVSFVAHVSAVIHDFVMGVANHAVAIVKTVHGFVTSITSHLTLLVTPTPKPAPTPPLADVQGQAKQAKAPGA